MKLLVERLPLNLLDQYSELFFFSLMLRIANDSSPDVKKAAFGA
jgi:hypothetical protein